MPDQTDVLLKLFETYNAIRLHNENLSRGAVAGITGASIALWSIAFGAKTVPNIRSTLLTVSVLLPIIGILVSYKLRQSNRELVLLSNRIRDKHLLASDHKEHKELEIIPKKWQIYDKDDFKFDPLSWWTLELSIYVILFGASMFMIHAHVHSGLWSTICSSH
jgi:hypothetical protein